MFDWRLHGLRERIALTVAPWLAEPEVQYVPVAVPYVTTTTNAAGAHATWRRTG